MTDYSTRPARPWWQTCSRDVFLDKLKNLQPNEILALGAEINAAARLLNAQLESRGDEDKDWRKKAVAALGFIEEKANLVESELLRRKISKNSPGEDPQVQAIKGLIREACELLENGDTTQALSVLDNALAVTP